MRGYLDGLSIHNLASKTSSSSGLESIFDRDFALKNNTADGNDLSCMYSIVHQNKYKMKIIPAIVSMSDYFILVPITHFLNGIRFPLDPAFVDLFEFNSIPTRTCSS